jgi:guanylate kinase
VADAGTEFSGVLMVLSAPLGVGKRTLCQALIDRNPDLRLSISKTTRPPAPREVHGYDYYFVTDEEFNRQVETGDFLEYVRIHNHGYATPWEPIRVHLAAGRDVLLDVDTRGALEIKRKRPEAVLVFVCPTNMEIVAARLMSFDPHREDLFSARLARAKEEISRAAQFDYVVLNDSLVETADELSAVLLAERRRSARTAGSLQKLMTSVPPLSPK